MASYCSPSCEEKCREINEALEKQSPLGLCLARQSPYERQQIKDTYRAMFGEDLIERLHINLIANQKNEMCNIAYMWMLAPPERDAILARDAVESSIIDYRVLTEIYTRRKLNQLFFTKQAYFARYKRNLDQDIITEPSHPYQRLLGALATSHRSHHDEVSQHIAKCDAKRLYDARSGRMGSIDESVILEIFSKRSIPQLKLAFSSYKHIYGNDLTKALKTDGNGEFEESLKVVVKCIYSPLKYYSKILHTSMKGPDTNKGLLNRVILGSDDVGMEEVKSAFETRYGEKLADAVHQKLPASDYRDFLVAATSDR